MTTLEQLSAAATELLPCPFCGCGPSSDEHAQQVQFYRAVGAPNGYVWCEGCGAEGPERQDRNAAIAAWNTRTGQLVAVQPDDATVERVARALKECPLWHDMDGDATIADFHVNDDMLIRLATAAIAAMKGPKL